MLTLIILSLTSVSLASSPKASKLTPSDLNRGAGVRGRTGFESSCSTPCENGICNETSGTCHCFPGWRGAQCHLCGGKIKLNSTTGWLADAVGNYTVDSKCTWLIEAPEKNSRIRLHIKEFATECGWDHLYVFDGDSVFADMKAVYSGMIRQKHYQVQSVPELVGDSGSMLLHFYSDVAYNMTGFNITFGINDCPSENSDVTCSGHGFCNTSTGKCTCDQDFVGEACSKPACPNNCKDKYGVRRGDCIANEKRCKCFTGWTGVSCSQSVDEGYWKVLSPSTDALSSSQFASTPRTSHVSLIDAWGRMWVLGGETFSRKTRHMVATYQIPKIDPKGRSVFGGAWQEIHANSNKGPSARYGHSAVLHEQKIYMYGGTMRSGHTSKELWSLDLDLLSWNRVEWVPGQCTDKKGNHKLCGPVHSMGHTAHVIASRMIVIFGHSPKYGYLDIVQEYHFDNKEWSIVKTKGYPVRGGFGHTSVWDDITNLIYVYGGYVSTLSSSSAISNDLYSFDPIYRVWKLHTASKSYRYLHSAVASNGLMLVFGGNTHNDTSFSHGAKCFSADFIVYDILCDNWYNSQSMIPRDLDTDLARFGHSAVIYNKSMIIHGGFHGKLKNDVFVYVSGNCGIFKTLSECLSSKVGVKCVWDSKKGSCRMHSKNSPKSGIETCLSGITETKEIAIISNNRSKICQGLRSCVSCVSTSHDCVWCGRSCQWRSCYADVKSTQATLSALAKKRQLKLESNEAEYDHNPEKKVIDNIDQCNEAGYAVTTKETCERLHTCHSCTAHEGCTWEIEKSSKCKATTGARNKKTNGNLTDDPGAESPCSPACSERTSCSNCTHGLCMWCMNLNLCIDRNAYLASFPYGQCMDWTTQSDSCPIPNKDHSIPDDLCLGYNTCDQCRSNPSCGWCDDGSLTGLGVCQMGGAEGPIVKKTHSHYEWVVNKSLCPAGDGRSWHFTSCPECQCNGHSNCSKVKGVCDQPCNDHTEGEHCEKCTKGFFGNAVNGGSCQTCDCNGQASSCNHESGMCHCTTKGIIGDHCEKCDKVNHYYGDPVKDSCFYDLAIDYQFTFNLSKSDDKHFTAINFKNEPTKVDVDVDFSIKCKSPAKMNLTYRYTPVNAKEGQETIIQTEVNCSEFKERFSKDEFVFGDSQENTTFFVYVYDFEPPLLIVISFSQHPKLDLLQFFITFSTCFLALLLVAAILWKIKQRYDRYRRRQRLFVEMEQMASRPFGTVLVELERIPETSNPSTSAGISNVNNISAVSSPIGEEYSGIMSTTNSNAALRRRKKKYRPSPIALEPCEGNRAAVLSLIVRLPMGGKPYAPPGYTGIAVASSLVTLGTHRKPSTDIATKQSVDDPKSNRKGRKNHHVSQPADI